jgi:adenosylcobinamide-phosphate synthase
LSSLTIVFAYVLDLILGDPQWFPHPVRLMGKIISGLQGLLRKVGSSPSWLRFAGVLLAAILCGVAYLATILLIHWATGLSWMAGMVCSSLLAYTTLATRDLHAESRKVLRALEAGDLMQARRELSFLVGRDTESLEEPEILRALVETVAENISDGVIAPLFYLALGGPAWAMTYKAINTLDSMIGYKDEKYRHIGGSGKGSLRILLRDHARHPSPNSAWPEAAMAGALGVQLGGLNYYFGQPSEKPLIGDRNKTIERRDVKEAWKILYLASFGMLLLALVLAAAGEKFLSLL